MKRKVNIDGMTCDHCVKSVTNALNLMNGIKEVDVSLENKCAILQAENVADEDIKRTIEDIGFDVEGIE